VVVYTASVRQPLALIVDPDDDLRSVYASVLRGEAYEIDEADDGRQALAKAIARHPDIVISETRLLGIDGFDLTRLLRSDRDTRDIPIVLITRDGHDQTLRRAHDAGASEVLVKPCVPHELMAAIRLQIAHSRELRERSRTVGDRVHALLARSDNLLAKSPQTRHVLVKSHNRRETTEPPLQPPTLRCPACDNVLRYEKSHIGGVSAKHSEQWDDYECAAGCGDFQYRQRTRKLRKI
jgi:CheY-like chemotaxis protein